MNVKLMNRKGYIDMNVIDMHCDTISGIYYANKRGETCNLRKNSFHLDIEKMEQGNYILQNFAMFVNIKEHSDPLEHCLDLIDCFHQQMELNKDRIRAVLCYDDILMNRKLGLMSALLTIEEGAVTGLKLSHLRNFYRLGVRMLTLNWNHENGIGYPNFLHMEGETENYKIPNTKLGLSKFGFEMIHEMESLGMIIDVSHLSDAGFYDVLQNTSKPFVASHSNARAKCNHVRNLTDDMIRALASRGGVIGVNYYANFLKEDMTPLEEEKSIAIIVDTINYMINIGGYECVGLGSDFDGIPTNKGIPDCSYMPRLFEELKSSGLNEDVIEHVFHKNVLRLYKDVLK